ncbi:MAG: helix-turn-helix domain-containing protein [Pseudomonadota bacterium]
MFHAYKGHGDKDILKAQQWLEAHAAESVGMENLARDLGISPRNFIRRFKKAAGESPLNYLRRPRIEKAKHALETTRDTVDEITQAMGYENSGAFRKLFKEFTGLSPREYRAKFARPSDREHQRRKQGRVS